MERSWFEIILILIICVGSYFLVAVPSGRLIEAFTREPLVKRIWHIALALCALFFFFGLSGVGDFVYQFATKNQSSAIVGDSLPIQFS